MGALLGEVRHAEEPTAKGPGHEVVGAVADVLAEYSGGGYRVRLEAVADLPAAADELTRAGAQVTAAADHLVVRAVDKPASITRTLAARDLYVSELAPVTADLESVFLELTGTAPVPGQHRQVDSPWSPALRH